jgi:uncharacterized protein YcbK (DUF882 family)
MVACCAFVAGTAVSTAETRSLKLYYTHTGEKAEIVFKRNGRYDQAGLRKINQFLRDWRRNEPTKMDPRLIDLVWSVYRSVGARDYVHVVSAYRSPATNSMLRSRSKGVAKRSQHMLGKAMDFYIPGVSLKKLREAGMKMQVGGVGYYPRSGSPFVHMDVGNVRHWPRMSRKELVALFPNGKTLHMPSDGKPLPGFEQALASYESRKKSGATAVAYAAPDSPKRKSLFAALFGGGEDEDAEAGVIEEAAPAPKPAKAVKEAAPTAVAAAPKAEPAKDLPGIQIVSPEDAQRVDLPVAAEPVATEPVEETPETIIAALPMRSVPLPHAAPRPKTEVGVTEVATGYPGSAATDKSTDIPFGAAQDEAVASAEGMSADMPFGQAQDEPAEVAVDARGVPLPTPRPEYAFAAVEEEDEPDQEAVLMALASGDTRSMAESGSIPMPLARPGDEQKADDQATVAAVIKANQERVAILESLEASAKRPVSQGVDPDTVASLGVKTTPKAARAKRNDAGPDRKVSVQAAQPASARWALDQSITASTNRTATAAAPAVAYNTVMSAPTEVYTDGFTTSDQGMAAANRFTGKAVAFKSVAKFQ